MKILILTALLFLDFYSNAQNKNVETISHVFIRSTEGSIPLERQKLKMKPMTFHFEGYESTIEIPAQDTIYFELSVFDDSMSPSNYFRLYKIQQDKLLQHRTVPVKKKSGYLIEPKISGEFEGLVSEKRQNTFIPLDQNNPSGTNIPSNMTVYSKSTYAITMINFKKMVQEKFVYQRLRNDLVIINVTGLKPGSYAIKVPHDRICYNNCVRVRY